MLFRSEALRIAAGVPREGLDTDDRTIPNEMGWLGPAVHLSKGCYRGQETVARVHNLGRPPRRLVLLHLDGSADAAPVPEAPVSWNGKSVGRVTSVAQHFELGPIALAVIKRSVPEDAGLIVDGLMTVGPTDGDPTRTRSTFATVRRLADELQLAGCSMGMSGDLTAALTEGSTLVRVGTALFGSR